MTVTVIPRTLAISDRLSFARLSLTKWAAAVSAAGVASIQLREKDLPARELWRLAREIRSAIGKETALILNGRVDLAASLSLSAVHLPANGLPTLAVRETLGSDALIGRSTHTLDEIRHARDDGASYVVFGPVWAVPGKHKGTPIGVDSLERACHLGIPVLALGGITKDRIPAALEAGASGVAGIRLFQRPEIVSEVVARVDRLLAR